MMSLRIVNVVTQLERAGAQTMAGWLSAELSPIAITSTVFLYRKFDHESFSVDDCLVDGRPNSPREAWNMWRRLRRIVRAHDLVIAHTHFAIAACLLASMGRRTPRVIAVHHWPVDRYPRVVRVALSAARKAGLMAAEVFVSDAIVDDRATRSVVIPNAVPVSLPTRDEEDLARRSVDLIVVARHALEKDISTALKAMAHLADRHLTLVGTGPMTSELRAEATKIGVADRVTFAGALPSGEVRRLMATSNGLVLASKWEAMPMVLLEAVSAGADIVVSDIPAHEFLTGHGAALAFDVGDAEQLAARVRQLQVESTKASLADGRARLKAVQSAELVSAQWMVLVLKVLGGAVSDDAKD